jgi:hypothetical protein
MRAALALFLSTPGGQFVLLDEVNKHHPPVILDHHDLSVGFCSTLNDGFLCFTAKAH